MIFVKKDYLKFNVKTSPLNRVGAAEGDAASISPEKSSETQNEQEYPDMSKVPSQYLDLRQFSARSDPQLCPYDCTIDSLPGFLESELTVLLAVRYVWM